VQQVIYVFFGIPNLNRWKNIWKSYPDACSGFPPPYCIVAILVLAKGRLVLEKPIVHMAKKTWHLELDIVGDPLHDEEHHLHQRDQMPRFSVWYHLPYGTEAGRAGID
jgi:hypothetical protein